MRTRLGLRPSPEALASRYDAVRALSVALVAPLSDADATVQSMEDASPAKWHLAHTTWFFETFVLRDFVSGYRRHDERFPFLFNSYYEAEGRRHSRARRGMVTRPSLDEVLTYRAAVDAALAAALPDLPEEARELVRLGCHHEEQHQELLITDILHALLEAGGRSLRSRAPEQYDQDHRRSFQSAGHRQYRQTLLGSGAGEFAHLLHPAQR